MKRVEESEGGIIEKKNTTRMDARCMSVVTVTVNN